MQDVSRPATVAERIVVVDVLRAVALFGIIIIHCMQGYLGSRPPRPGFMNMSMLDGAVASVGFMLVFGKFFTIFSFLFGLSFALQMNSAAQKGAAFAGRFTWRLVVLALIALVHGAFYAGDILIIYAFLGLLLIPCRAVNTKVLLVAAVVLILNVPGLILGWRGLNTPAPAATIEQQQAAELALAQDRQLRQQQFDIRRSGPAAEIMRLNLTDGVTSKLAFQLRSGRLWITFGLFLLGLCAGRLEIFRETPAHRAFFRRLMWGAGAAAVVTTAIAILRPSGFQVNSLADLAASFSFTLQQASLSAFYVAVVTLLFWRAPKRGLLPQLAPTGKMGLTTYLTQTAFGVLLFQGFGLSMIGQIGTAAAVGLGILFFCAQVLFSRWWMSRFRMGPVEWLWRAATYFTLQPASRGVAKPA